MSPTRLPVSIRQILTSLLFAVACAWSVAPDRPRTVAVLDFKGRGVSREFADSVADRLSQVLRETGRFDARDRDSVSGWRDRGRGGGFLARCDEWDCAIRAGRVMGVERTILGAVSAEGSVLRLSVRMMDVEREVPLEKQEFRTDRGSKDALGRGCSVLAAAFAAQEPSRGSTVAPEAALASPDRIRIARTEKELRLWRRTAGATAIAGGVALAIGGALFVGNSTGCAFSGEGPCKEPDRTLQNVLIASGVVLEGVAIASGIAAIARSRELRALERRMSSEISWVPWWNPATGSLGCATRLEF